MVDVLEPLIGADAMVLDVMGAVVMEEDVSRYRGAEDEINDGRGEGLEERSIDLSGFE